MQFSEKYTNVLTVIESSIKSNLILESIKISLEIIKTAILTYDEYKITRTKNIS